MQNICKRCFLLESGKGDTLKNIKEHIEKIADAERCADGGYKERLKICGECEWLSDGTCLKCGCYPEFRAAFLKQRCPCKKW